MTGHTCRHRFCDEERTTALRTPETDPHAGQFVYTFYAGWTKVNAETFAAHIRKINAAIVNSADDWRCLYEPAKHKMRLTLTRYD